MIFTVIYREKSGTKTEMEIEASSRAECIARCKTQGIAPIGVRDGRSGSHASSRKRFPVICYLFAVIVALVGIVWWLVREGEATQPKLEPGTLKAETPKAGRKHTEKPVKKKDIVVANTDTPTLKPHKGSAWQPKVVPVKTADIQPPAIESQDVINLRELNRKFYGTPIFKYTSENTIAGILTSIPGERFVLDELDPGFDRDFAKSLEEQIEVFPDDPEDVKAQKTAVIAARDQLAQVLAKGESPGSVLSGMMKDLNAIADYRDKLEDNVRLLCKEGSEQDIRIYLEEANKMLSEYNALPIEISPKRWRLIQRRLAEEAKQNGDGKLQ